MGVHWKIRFLEGFMKNQYIGKNCLRRGAWTISRLKRGLGKNRGWCFWKGVDTPMHTMETLTLTFFLHCGTQSSLSQQVDGIIDHSIFKLLWVYGITFLLSSY